MKQPLCILIDGEKKKFSTQLANYGHWKEIEITHDLPLESSCSGTDWNFIGSLNLGSLRVSKPDKLHKVLSD